jgi:hypothetical protein
VLATPSGGLARSWPGRQRSYTTGLGPAFRVAGAGRTFAWLHKSKRLLVRYMRRDDIHLALLAIGCCLVCFRRSGAQSDMTS